MVLVSSPLGEKVAAKRPDEGAGAAGKRAQRTYFWFHFRITGSLKSCS